MLIGETADKIAQAIRRGTAGREAGAAGVPEVLRAGSIEDAVRIAAARAEPGEVVLLSPACASYDMFSNFAERGRRFGQAVQALVGGEGAHGPNRGG